MADELLIKIDVEGSGDIEKLDKNIENVGKTTKKTQNELTQLRKEIKEGKSEMLKYAEGTAEYNRALNRTAAAQGKLKETNDIIRASVRDLGSTVKMVGGAIGGLTAGFQVAQGAMALFGVENENTLKVIQNITAAMSVTQGIVQFANGFDDLQDLLTGFRASAAMTSDAIGELSDVGKDAGNSLANIAKEGAVIGSNLAGTQAIADQTTNSYEKMTMSLEDYMKANVKGTASIKEAEAALLEYKQKTDENKKQIDEITDGLKENSKAQDDLTKSTEKATSGIGRQLLVMGGWIAAIAVVTYGITKLIEWLNKIPEDVKVNIDVNTDVFKQLTKDQIKIKTFLNDYNKAIKDVNKDRITELEKYAKKEFDLTDAALSKYKDSDLKKLESSKELFAKYLKLAEDTYWNESIIKRKVEAQQSAITAKSAAIQLFKSQSDTGNMAGKTAQSGLSAKTSGGWTWEQLVEAAQKNDWGGKTDADLRAFGIPQQIIDELRKVILSNEIIKGLPKLRNVDMGTGTGGSGTGNGTGSKLSLDLQKGLTDVDKQRVISDTFKQKSFELGNEKLTKYTEEEKVIMEYNLKERKKWYYDSLISEMEFQLKREKARGEDLQNERVNTINQINEQQKLADSFDQQKANYDILSAEINSFYNNKAAIQNQNIALEKRISDIQNQNSIIQKKSTDDTLVNDQKKIESNNKLINSIKATISINEASIASINNDIEAKKEEAVEIEKLLGDLTQTPEKLEDLKNKLLSINVEITDAIANQAQIERDIWAEKLQNFKGYVDAVGKLSDTFVNMTSDQMEIIDNRTNKEKNDLELSEKYRKADSESQQQMMYELELANYNQKKKVFETNKAFQISSAIITGISGELEAIGNFLKNGGFVNPLAIASLAAETIAITTGTILTVKKIASTSLDKPIPPSAGSGSGGNGGFNVALNPAKDSLTSNDERLNTMQKSNIKDMPQQKVLVSDINSVQAKVKTREENSSF